MKKIRLGFIPLSDCAPLVIAQELNIFEKYDLEVELVKETSWANIRDKVVTGALHGAQMLASMPISATLGVGGIETPMLTTMVMNLNGNAITVSKHLYEAIQKAAPETLTSRPVTAAGLKTIISENSKTGRPRLRFAVVFPTSTHTYELRYWLASAGIDPDSDIEIIVIPPQQMVENLRSGNIDGFCVGEPWNSLAIREGLGHCLITKYEIWNNSPEKVFAVTREWAEKNTDTHYRIIKALLEAGRWLDASTENRLQAAEILSQSEYINVDADVIKMSMAGTFQYSSTTSPLSVPDFNVFYRYSANYPWRSHAIWLISQMIRWGHIREAIDIHAMAAEIYRPDLYRQALAGFGTQIPSQDFKNEGLHDEPWEDDTQQLQLGADSFFDGKQFKHEQVREYLQSFAIKHLAYELN